MAALDALIRSIPDFPQPGILYRDITPLLFDAAARNAAMEAMTEAARTLNAEVVAGVEARGFIFGLPVAERLGVPFVPMRKAGKLPSEVVRADYALEYGTATLEMHRTPSVAGRRVAVIDDLLATGGTAAAAAHLIEESGGSVAGFVFLIELAALEGRAALHGRTVRAVLEY
ncbi:MAG: adenine phosphoribosyltransferase [Dehalococcoidia bacterium]|nr:MAG: adenine phosphoribosyltransferase [Dehalococcoidia bacterium]